MRRDFFEKSNENRDGKNLFSLAKRLVKTRIASNEATLHLDAERL